MKVECPHRRWTLLGTDKGDNRYYRCEDCGCGIIVSPEGQAWQIPPKTQIQNEME